MTPERKHASPARPPARAIRSADAWHFRLGDLPSLPRPERVLLVEPTYFEVAYVINPHMRGNIGTVDRERARAQWDALRDAYQRLGLQVDVMPGAPGMPDLVFCANQSLPYLEEDGTRGAVMGAMHAPQRRPEVPLIEAHLRSRGYATEHVAPGRGSFEGMGDALWHPGRRLLWGGHGHRTDPEVYDRLARFLDVPILTLELTDPVYYHLDTCFALLDERTVLIQPEAFSTTGREFIETVFADGTVLEAPPDESARLLACNAHCPDGRHVLIQRGCTETNGLLREAGFEPLELETGEFLKAGGSVFCMKLAYW